MRIILPIKQVPETRKVRMDETTGTVIREGVQSIVNPLDLYAIEAALAIKQRLGCELVGISMGPLKAQAALREAMAMGLDSGVLASDRAFGGSDTWATSYVLSKVIERLGEYDLIICGERATDGDTGQVGPGIAAFLDLPVITYVSEIVKVDGEGCTVRRMVESGYEVLSVRFPAVLTVVKEIGQPRLPTLRGKQRAKATEIPLWGHDELGIDAEEVGLKGSPTRVVKTFKPQVVRECEMFDGTDEHKAETATKQIAETIKDMEVGLNG